MKSDGGIFMKKVKTTFFTAKNIAILGVLLALVIVLQAFGLAVTLPGGTSMSFVLVPIVVGGMLLGPGAGAFLGLAFGIVTLFDPLTLTLINYVPVAVIATVLLKGIAAGIAPSLLFALISGRNGYVASFVAALSAPIVNTGIFFIGCLVMREALVQAVGMAFWAFIGLIAINFAIEVVINGVLAPAIYSVDRVVERRILIKKSTDSVK